MKSYLRFFLQKVFGFHTYLYYFSMYSIRRVLKGKYEKGFLYFVDQIPNQGIILDIGANIGITAVPIAKKLPNAEIHAFEPIEENFDALSRVINTWKAHNVKLFKVALGDKSGNLKMIMPMNGKVKMQGLSKIYEESTNEKGIIYEVPITQLDTIYNKEKNIKAIKIDVENFELEVLIGEKQLLVDNKPLIYCELWNNEKRLMLVDYLSSLGYSCYIFNNNKLEPVAVPNECNDTNFFFIHKENFKAI
jgi:FkbM family methyltransferase